ncbi:MAG: phosphonoacetaldehyde hydrolase [Anaerolineae bacterium]|nr:phosphonoacetaldehyde hydrolase [Anaerolineae bacterium]
MDFVFRRSYRGPIQGLILDWAGTTVDFGSFAPTAVFLKLFASRGVSIQIDHARRPMGLMKKDHLRAILSIPEVAQSWQDQYGRPAGENDVEDLFSEFVPMQIACLSEYAGVIRGVPEQIAALRKMGIKIGSTTGYTRRMMEVLVPAARQNGYEPDVWVSADDTPAGRPYPWMCYQNAIQMQIYPMESIIKVGDTLADIEEGLNAGMWTVGLSLSGNLLGLTENEFEQLPSSEIEQQRKKISGILYQAGAHYVIDGLWDLATILGDIQNKLMHGERP